MLTCAGLETNGPITEASRGPRFIKLGRLIRYRNADVDAYLEAHTRGKAA